MKSFFGSALFLALAAAPQMGTAQEVPFSYKASPAVYTLLGEDENFRVILGTWKPGQRDEWHSHSQLTAYSLTGCEERIHTPDGKYVDRTRVKGGVAFSGAIASHSLQNRGNTECQALIVERKQ